MTPFPMERPRRAARLLFQGQSLATVREVDRLLRLPRRVPGRSTLLPGGLDYVDAASLVSAWRAIWVDGIYDIDPATPRPRLIDAGANIGLASLRWLHRHVEGTVVAFEPDPQVADVFEGNLGDDDRVELVRAALWSSHGVQEMHTDSSDAGRLAAAGALPAVSQATRDVRTVALSPWLDDPVALLKLDIEGAEMEVLTAADLDLSKVDRLFVEYHGAATQPHRLAELLELLADSGYRTFPLTEFCSPRPFLERHIDAGMDLRVNVAAVREHVLPETP